MSIQKVPSKFATFRWVTENGEVYKYKRTLKRDGGRYVYMQCANEENCKGSCNVFFDEPFNSDSVRGRVVKKSHTFDNCCDLSFSERENLRRRILERAATENTQNSVIFQQEISRAPLSVRNLINFKEIERSMQRAHKEKNPKSPNSLTEMGQSIHLWIEKFGKVNEEQFFLGNFGNGEEECLVAVNPIGHHIEFKDTDWHLDGTFKCRPQSPQFSQLYVIMASAYGRAFPIVWALMKSRTSRAYDILFETVKNTFPDMKPKLIMSDYEKAVKKSVRKYFPESKHQGCWFHFSQAIERNARGMRIKRNDAVHNDGWRVARQLMATALLPPHRIEEAVGVIEGLAENCVEAEKPKKLIAYFRNEWIMKVTPQSFSVHGQAERTNNSQESLNRCINRTVKPQGSAWDFWNGLMEITIKEINYFSNLSEGRECTRKKKMKWMLQNSNISSLQIKLETGIINIAQFLIAASCRIASNPIEADVPEDLHMDVERGPV